MMDWMHRLRAIGVAACLGALAACGGGGGHGKDDTVMVSVDRTSLSFGGFVGHPAGSEQLNFTLTQGEGTFYALVELDRSDAFYTPSLSLGDTGATLTLTPVHATPQRRTGTLAFKLCRDASCNHVAWSRTIPYTLVSYELQAELVTINAFQGASAEARVAVLPSGGAAELTTTLADEYRYGPAPWLTARAEGDDLVIAVDAATLAQGSQGRSFDVRVAGSVQGGSVPLGVSVNVGSGLALPAPLTLQQRVDSAAGALQGSLPVAFNGGLAPAWTARSTADWLVLDTHAGTGPGDLRFHADPALLAAAGPWDDLNAEVEISAAGLTPASVAVTLQRRLPHVTWVHPTTVASGSAATVTVQGRGFSQLAGVSALQPGGLTVTGGAIESDTVARLELGAPASGRYRVSVANAAGEVTAAAMLSSRPVAPAASAYVPHPGDKRAAVYDDSRQAVFAVGYDEESLVRYRLEGGSWQTTTLWLPFANTLALAADRSTVYVTVGDDELVEVDADSMTVRTRHQAQGLSSLRETVSRSNPLAVTRDGRVWVNQNGGYFDTVARRFGQSTEVAEGHRAQQPSQYAPADGSRLVLAGISNFGDYGVYDADTGLVQRTPQMPQVASTAALSADAAVMLVDNHSLHRRSDWALLGYAAIANADSNRGWLVGVVSPDGRRVYRVAYTGSNSATVDRVDVFDATRRVPGSSYLVPLGSIPVPNQATCSGWSGDWCDMQGALHIDPLGATLYWTGSLGMAVLPIPPELRASAAAAPATVLRRAAH